MTKNTYDWLGPAEEAESVGPAVDGSVEAAQVDKFLDMEAEIMKDIDTTTPTEGEEATPIEVETMPTEVETTPVEKEATPTEQLKSNLPPTVEIEVGNIELAL